MLITSGNKRVKGRRGNDYDTVNTVLGMEQGLNFSHNTRQFFEKTSFTKRHP